MVRTHTPAHLIRSAAACAGNLAAPEATAAASRSVGPMAQVDEIAWTARETGTLRWWINLGSATIVEDIKGSKGGVVIWGERRGGHRAVGLMSWFKWVDYTRQGNGAESWGATWVQVGGRR